MLTVWQLTPQLLKWCEGNYFKFKIPLYRLKHKKEVMNFKLYKFRFTIWPNFCLSFSFSFLRLWMLPLYSNKTMFVHFYITYFYIVIANFIFNHDFRWFLSFALRIPYCAYKSRNQAKKRAHSENAVLFFNHYTF